jgi:hypothetical protein
MDLLIVAKDRPMLYDAFRRMSAGDADIEITVDRRERAGSPPPSVLERRRLDVSEALKTTGWAVVPGRARRQARTDAA